MKRKTGLLLGMALWLGLVAVVLAGGWAVVTLDEPPGEIRAGRPWTVGFTILQHGKTPVHKLDANNPIEPLLVTAHAGRRIEVQATPTDEVGHFVAEVTFPTEGAWEWTIYPNPLAGDTAFEPLIVLPAAAPQASGAVNAGVLAAPAVTPAGSTAAGLRWAAVGVAGLALLVALFQIRRRSIAKPQVES